MKYNIFFKLFTFLFLLIIFIMPVSAQKEVINNILNKIEVEQSDDNTYKLNLFFYEKFKGNALIQKDENGIYSVFIPNTEINSKNLKVIYQNKYDKSKIQVVPEEKNFIKNGRESKYVELSLKTAYDYPVKLYNKIYEEEESFLPSSFISINLFSFIIMLSLGILVFLIISIIKLSKNKSTNSYTIFPSNIKTSVDYEMDKSEVTLKPMLNKINIKETLKSQERNSFSCFDIPIENDYTPKQKEYYNSPLKETSSVFKKKTLKSKQTNPLNTFDYTHEASDLALPAAEDILKNTKEENVKEKDKNKEPDLLSKLEITPTKGFYLTSLDSTFALFGYAGKNVFLLKKFSDLSQINLQARFYDRQQNKDLYIVRLDSYKAMIEISDSNMKELAAL